MRWKPHWREKEKCLEGVCFRTNACLTEWLTCRIQSLSSVLFYPENKPGIVEQLAAEGVWGWGHIHSSSYILQQPHTGLYNVTSANIKPPVSTGGDSTFCLALV